jgi:hypothetical protein
MSTPARNNLRRTGATWVVFVVMLSLQPVRLRSTIRGTAAHLLLHVVMFGFAAIAPLLLSGNRAQESARAFFVLCLAVAIEIAQRLIYGHRTEWWDVEMDGAGVLLAFVAIRFWRLRRVCGNINN